MAVSPEMVGTERPPTNALSHEADIAKVEEWLSSAPMFPPRQYDRRKRRPENSPTFGSDTKRKLMT